MNLNVLSAAMGAVGSVYPSQSVILIRRKVELIEGRSIITKDRQEAVAIIQPVDSKVTSVLEGAGINATNARRFWINGNRANVVNFFENFDETNSRIAVKTGIYTIFSKFDWENNGWIKLIGVLNADSPL